MSALPDVSTAETWSPKVPAGWPFPTAARLVWLHLRSRRVPAALLALLACGLVLWAALSTTGGTAAATPPTSCRRSSRGARRRSSGSPRTARSASRSGRPAAGCRTCGRRGPRAVRGRHRVAGPRRGGRLRPADQRRPDPRDAAGRPEPARLHRHRAAALAGRRRPAVLDRPARLHRHLPVRAIANYSEPITWAARPPADRGGWIAALAVFAVGLAAFTIRGPRIRPSGE